VTVKFVVNMENSSFKVLKTLSSRLSVVCDRNQAYNFFSPNLI